MPIYLSLVLFIFLGCGKQTPTQGPEAPVAGREYSVVESLEIAYEPPPSRSLITGSLRRPDKELAVFYFPLTWNQTQELNSPSGALPTAAKLTCTSSDTYCREFSLDVWDKDFRIEQPLAGKISFFKTYESSETRPAVATTEKAWADFLAAGVKWVDCNFVETTSPKQGFLQLNFFSTQEHFGRNGLFSFSRPTSGTDNLRYHYRSGTSGAQGWGSEKGNLTVDGKKITLNYGPREIRITK